MIGGSGNHWLSATVQQVRHTGLYSVAPFSDDLLVRKPYLITQQYTIEELTSAYVMSK